MLTDAQVEATVAERHERVARLYLQGQTQRQIAKVVGVSQTQVCFDLQAIREEWRKSALMNFTERQAQELAKLERLEAEAWDAWERSKAEQLQTYAETEQTLPADGEPAAAPVPRKPRTKRSKSSIRKTQSAGEDRFMEVILKCVERRCKMLGIDAPSKVELSGGLKSEMSIDLTKATDEELDELERIAARIGSATPDPGSHQG